MCTNPGGNSILIAGNFIIIKNMKYLLCDARNQVIRLVLRDLEEAES